MGKNPVVLEVGLEKGISHGKYIAVLHAIFQPHFLFFALGVAVSDHQHLFFIGTLSKAAGQGDGLAQG